MPFFSTRGARPHAQFLSLRLEDNFRSSSARCDRMRACPRDSRSHYPLRPPDAPKMQRRGKRSRKANAKYASEEQIAQAGSVALPGDSLKSKGKKGVTNAQSSVVDTAGGRGASLGPIPRREKGNTVTLPLHKPCGVARNASKAVDNDKAGSSEARDMDVMSAEVTPEKLAPISGAEGGGEEVVEGVDDNVVGEGSSGKPQRKARSSGRALSKKPKSTGTVARELDLQGKNYTIADVENSHAGRITGSLMVWTKEKLAILKKLVSNKDLLEIPKFTAREFSWPLVIKLNSYSAFAGKEAVTKDLLVKQLKLSKEALENQLEDKEPDVRAEYELLASRTPKGMTNYFTNIAQWYKDRDACREAGMPDPPLPEHTW